MCRRHGVSSTTLYKWKAKFGGMTVPEARRLRGLEDEKRRLKQPLAEAMLDNLALKGLLAKNGRACGEAGGGGAGTDGARAVATPGL